jgi:hypothetical protein
MKEKILAPQIEHIVKENERKLFGALGNEEAVSKWFDFLLYEFKYKCLPDYGTLLHDGQLDKIVSDDMSDEDLALLANRLQEHAQNMHDHLETSLIPKLSYIDEQVKYEHLKMQRLLEHQENVSKMYRHHKDLEATLLNQSFEIMDIRQQLEREFNQF